MSHDNNQPGSPKIIMLRERAGFIFYQRFKCQMPGILRLRERWGRGREGECVMRDSKQSPQNTLKSLSGSFSWTHLVFSGKRLFRGSSNGKPAVMAIVYSTLFLLDSDFAQCRHGTLWFKLARMTEGQKGAMACSCYHGMLRARKDFKWDNLWC